MQTLNRKALRGSMCTEEKQLIETRRSEIKCDVSGLCYKTRRCVWPYSSPTAQLFGYILSSVQSSRNFSGRFYLCFWDV